MSIHDNATALTGRALALEGIGANPMPKSNRVLFHDRFDDGRFHGWRPVHFGVSRPFNPLSVETDYPGPGLFMATAPAPYRANAFGNTVGTSRGLSGRLPTSGIVTFAGKFYVQSGGPDGYAWSGWEMGFDVQNWSDTQRSNPALQCANPLDGSAARWKIKDDSGTMVSIGSGSSRTVTDGVTTSGSPVLTSATAAFTSADVGKFVSVNTTAGIAATIISVQSSTQATMSVSAATAHTGRSVTVGKLNPVNPALGATSATRDLAAGENENKWDENYVRLSFDLGNLFTTTSTPTSQYYEANLNGFRFDLRDELGGRAARTTQGGTALSSFRGGVNFMLNLYRDTTAGSKVWPARLVAGELVGLYHETGWLA